MARPDPLEATRSAIRAYLAYRKEHGRAPSRWWIEKVERGLKQPALPQSEGRPIRTDPNDWRAGRGSGFEREE